MNAEKWKWFRYDEIFEIKKGFFNKKPEESGFGTIPFIGATDSNNGVTSWYTIDEIDSTPKAENTENVSLNEKIFETPCITVSNNGSVGYAFYQTQPFTCSHDVNPLYLKDRTVILTPMLAIFLCGIIECEQFRWTYGRKWRPERMPNSLIKLPINEKEQPDWQWMEDYAKNALLPQLPEKSRQVWEKRYNNQPLSTQKLELKVDEWKWFKIGDLFLEIYKAKAHIKQEVNITNDTSRGIIFVSRTETNNGCDVFVERDDGMVVEEGNAIIIGDTTATCFYQEKEFTTGDHIIVCRSNWLNKNTALFFKTIMDNEKYRFNYGRAFKMELVKEHKIKLPATTNENGEIVPDWQWMENYIKGLPYSGAL